MQCDLTRSNFCGEMKQGSRLRLQIANLKKNHLPWYFDRRNQQCGNLELQDFRHKMSYMSHSIFDSYLTHDQWYSTIQCHHAIACSILGAEKGFK